MAVMQQHGCKPPLEEEEDLRGLELANMSEGISHQPPAMEEERTYCKYYRNTTVVVSRNVVLRFF